LNSTDIGRKYTKSHAHINPKAITPMGPIPDIESGVEKDWSKIKAGGVKLPA
jgi:putative glutathione S-transferase